MAKFDKTKEYDVFMGMLGEASRLNSPYEVMSFYVNTVPTYLESIYMRGLAEGYEKAKKEFEQKLAKLN
jgi:hypothetical protein